MAKIAVVAGAGPGNGGAISRRLARAGYDVAVLARSGDYVEKLAGELRGLDARSLGLQADLADADDVARAFDRIRNELGPVEVLVQNAAPMIRGGFLDLRPEEFETAFQISVMGMVHCCRAVLGEMASRGEGAIVVIGATGAVRGSVGFAPFAVGKFGQRALGQSLAREFGPQGVHVAHVIIDGVIESERSRGFFPDQDSTFFLQPDDIAEAVYHLIQQPRSAWTHEIDLRPFGERF